MLHHPPAPHVSPALVRLRLYVSLAAATVVLCAAAQLLVLGFVHFTDVRFTTITAPIDQQPLSVVRSVPVPSQITAPIETSAPPPPPAGLAANAVIEPDAPTAAAPAPANPSQMVVGRAELQAAQRAALTPPPTARALTAWDAGLRRLSNLAVSLGVMSVGVLAVLTFLGVAVAGGGAVPGVERAVNSAAWACILALASIPWASILPTVSWPGVFGPYEAMTAASTALDAAGGFGATFFALYAFMPLLAIMLGIAIVMNFRAGVERGIVITSVSQLDEAVEAEINSIRSRGVGTNMGARNVGILNRAIGDTEGTAPAPASAGPVAAVASALAAKARSTAPSQPGAKPKPWISDDDPLLSDSGKRPI